MPVQLCTSGLLFPKDYECSLCLEEFPQKKFYIGHLCDKTKDKVCHVFHQSCWYECVTKKTENEKCPTCREETLPPSDPLPMLDPLLVKMDLYLAKVSESRLKWIREFFETIRNNRDSDGDKLRQVLTNLDAYESLELVAEAKDAAKSYFLFEEVKEEPRQAILNFGIDLPEVVLKRHKLRAKIEVPFFIKPFISYPNLRLVSKAKVIGIISLVGLVAAVIFGIIVGLIINANQIFLFSSLLLSATIAGACTFLALTIATLATILFIHLKNPSIA